MLTPSEILPLLHDLESDRVERTISTTNTDKFGQAICAFANDLPHHSKPGYLLIGAEDDGRVHGTEITDRLLRDIAAIRTDGNIQPQPSMDVAKVSLADGDLLVVEVYPSTLPPVKYKGRIWVRVGARKGVANDDDERRLYERRAANITTHDAEPCVGATVSDLDTSVFRQIYLPKAVPEDVLRDDRRSVEAQLQSLGFFNCRLGCPTYAGLLLFGRDVERFMPGAYVQYVRFAGKSRAADIKSEYKFAGNLCRLLFQLDTFVDTAIALRRPVPVSALREETMQEYPHWAIRELLMNAIAHRDYGGNGPVQFYQYDDRIEIMNPGGLYGKATPENFPLVNDYRNPVVAEALKVLGFANRFSRGVERVKRELAEGGNGTPTFSLSLGTAFVVSVSISHNALLFLSLSDEKVKESDRKEASDKQEVADTESESDNKGERKNGSERKSDIKKSLTANERNLLRLLEFNPRCTYAEMTDNIGLSHTSIYKVLNHLRALGLLTRENGRKHGHWVVLGG